MHGVSISLGGNRFLSLNDQDNGLYLIQQNDRGHIVDKMYLCDATKASASIVQDCLERMKTFLS